MRAIGLSLLLGLGLSACASDARVVECAAVCEDEPAGAETPGRVTLRRLLAEMTDLEVLARLPDPPYRSLQVSSRDRATTSPDAPDWYSNYDGGSFERIEGDEKVMLDAEGPGVLVRVWSANPNGTWRFYVDGNPEPVIEAPFDAITAGRVDPIGEPFAYVSARGHSMYLPIGFRERLRVTTDGDLQFHHFGYRRYEPGVDVEPFSLEALREARCPRSTACDGLTAGPRLPEGRTESATLGGAASDELVVSAGAAGGLIRQLRARPRDTSDTALRETVLSVAFDGAETVRVPLGDFFGGGPGLNPLESVASDVDADGTLTARWPMPFEREARIGVTGAEVELEIVHDDFAWDDESLHFHARWRPPEALLTDTLRDLRFLSIAGEGHYAGTVLNVANPAEAWWGEGDERIRVDGGAWTDWLGTGTEDYFGYAWSSNEVFARPYHGQPRADGPRNRGRIVNYRWHVLDPIPFAESFELYFEIHHWLKGDEAVTMTYDSVMMWYARPGATDDLPAFDTGSIPPLPE